MNDPWRTEISCVLEDAFIIDDLRATKDLDDQAITDIAINQLQKSFTKIPLQNIAKIKPSQGKFAHKAYLIFIL